LNWAFTKESYAMARLLLRERSSPVEVRPGQTPAHSQPLIPYTTTRDTIRLESQTPFEGGPMRLPSMPRTRAIPLAHEALVPQETAVRVGTTAHRSAIGYTHALLNDLADGGTGLVQSASLLISDLFQHYGLAEPAQLSRDGSIIASGWSEPERTRISTWAQQVAVPVT
jgi:hypothetical protein